MSAVRLRAVQARAKLPKEWVFIFLDEWPEYDAERQLISDVAAGIEENETITNKLEILADTLKQQ